MIVLTKKFRLTESVEILVRYGYKRQIYLRDFYF